MSFSTWQAADEMLEVAELEAGQLPPEWTARSYGQPLALKQAAQLRAAYVRRLRARTSALVRPVN